MLGAKAKVWALEIRWSVDGCERPGKFPQKREIFGVFFREPLFLGKWCGVATYFFLYKKKINKYMTELFSSLIE